MKAEDFWLVEYEIPPLRAIYHVETEAVEDEEETKKMFLAAYPRAKIRKITKTLKPTPLE